MQKLDEIVFPLLEWYEQNARILPWRENQDPYRVWVSEIMLQQTRVTAVVDYFTRFMARLPTVLDLAEIPEDELMKLWQGLGYYSRARNLQKAARQIRDDFGGAFPQDVSGLKSLAGIGDYTAAAVASIAFGKPHPAVDGNLLRVVARLTADPTDITTPTMKKRVTDLLTACMPPKQAGAFNQALMDLGAMVCLPNGTPLCASCPLKTDCQAYAQNLTGSLPVRAPKKARRKEDRDVFLFIHAGKIALRKRPNTGLLAKLWEYPNLEKTAENPDISFELAGKTPVFVGTGRHIFTHIEWYLRGFAVVLDSADLPPDWVWASWQELQEIYAIPTAFSSMQEAVKQLLCEEES